MRLPDSGMSLAVGCRLSQLTETMATNLAELTEAPDTTPQKAASTQKSETAHKEALLDEALVETFPASDPISPAYEARLEAQRAGQDEENARMQRIGKSVLSGLAAVAALAAVAWLARSLNRHER